MPLSELREPIHEWPVSPAVTPNRAFSLARSTPLAFPACPSDAVAATRLPVFR